MTPLRPQRVASQNASRPCDGGQDPFAGIWDDARRKQAEVAILATDLSYADDTWERVEARLDEYTQAWTAQHTDACEATHVRREQSEEVMALRMRCLSGRRTATREVLEVLVEANAGVVDKAVDMVTGLPRTWGRDSRQRDSRCARRRPISAPNFPSTARSRGSGRRTRRPRPAAGWPCHHRQTVRKTRFRWRQVDVAKLSVCGNLAPGPD